VKVTLTYQVIYDTDAFMDEIVQKSDDYPVTQETIVEFCLDRFISPDKKLVDPIGEVTVSVE